MGSYVIGPGLSGTSNQTLQNNLTVLQRNSLGKIEQLSTGQTASYATGDDGSFKYGRSVPWDQLAIVNDFGNTNRFTTDTGGNYLLNNTGTLNYIIDHETGLAVYAVPQSSVAWATAISNAQTFSTGVYTSGWYLPNICEFLGMCDFGSGNITNGKSPFLNSANTSYWTSTTDPVSTSLALFVNSQFGSNNLSSGFAKTSSKLYYIVRQHYPIV